MFKSVYFYIIVFFLLVITSGLIYHKCEIDSLKENNQRLLSQLLKASDYQTQKLIGTVSSVQTLETKELSKDIVSKILQETLDKYNLKSMYESSLSLRATLSKVLEGQSGATELISRVSTATLAPSTTTIIEREIHDSNTSISPRGCDIPSNNQPSPENVSVCNQCLSANIIRVPFEDYSDPLLSITGYTESGNAINTNGTYHLEIKWLQDILLSIALAQDESGVWTTLIDSNDPNIDISRIRSEITIEPFERKWYQNITLGLGLGFGASGVLLNGALGYRIDNNFALAGNWWYVMPFFGEISNYNFNAFYGASLTMNL